MSQIDDIFASIQSYKISRQDPGLFFELLGLHQVAISAVISSIQTAGGLGNVIGPGSSINSSIVRWDGVTGVFITDSLVNIDNAGDITGPVGGLVYGRDLTADGAKLDTVELGATANPYAPSGTPVVVSRAPGDPGVSTFAARFDHQHHVSVDLPVDIGAVNSLGTNLSLSVSDHVHAHGAQTDPTMHATATAALAGFLSAADKVKLDAIPPTIVSATTQVIAGNGLDGGGALSSDVTLNVVANADGSIVVNGDDIQVGILATDAQHGLRGGGTLHSEATVVTAGFLSAADKIRIDALPPVSVPTTRQVIAGAGLVGGGQLTGDVTLNVASVDSSIVVNADSIQVGVLATDAQHGIRIGSNLHATATTLSPGFFPTVEAIGTIPYSNGTDLSQLATASTPNTFLRANGAAAPVWTQIPLATGRGTFSSTTTVAFPSSGVPNTVNFNINEELVGIGLVHSTSVNPSRFIAAADCDMTLLFQAQISRLAPSSQDAVVWVLKNGVAIANSASRLRLTTLNDNAVLSIGITVRLNANDYIELAFTCEDVSAGRYSLINTASVGSIPQTPAVIAAVITTQRVS